MHAAGTLDVLPLNSLRIVPFECERWHIIWTEQPRHFLDERFQIRHIRLAEGHTAAVTATHQLSRCAIGWSRAGGRGVHVALMGPSLWCSHHNKKEILWDP